MIGYSPLPYKQVINVLRYGADPTGVADSTAAINAAIAAIPATGAVLYFPAGSYKSQGGHTIATTTIVLGDGQLVLGGTGRGAWSQISCTVQNATLFTVTALTARFESLALVNTATGGPTAGAGISCQGTNYLQRVDYSHVWVAGFFVDVDIQTGYLWVMDDCTILESVSHGVKIQNTLNADAGDWVISNCVLSRGGTAGAGAAAICQLSGGGGKISDSKINGNPAGGYAYDYGVLVQSAGGTSDLIVADSSIENVHINGINANAVWPNMVISGVQIAILQVTNTPGIALTNVANSVIAGCTLNSGGSNTAAIALLNCSNVVIGAVSQAGYTGTVSQVSCTSCIDMSNHPAGELGYAALLSTFTTASTAFVSVGIALAVTATGGSLLIEVNIPTVSHSAANAQAVVALYDINAGAVIQQCTINMNANGAGSPLLMRVRVNPAGGARTYTVQAKTVTAGTLTLAGAAGAPIELHVMGV